MWEFLYPLTKFFLQTTQIWILASSIWKMTSILPTAWWQISSSSSTLIFHITKCKFPLVINALSHFPTTKSFTPNFGSRSRQCRTLFFIQNSIHKYRYDRRAEDKNFPVFDFTSSYFLVQHKIYTHLMRNEGSKRKRK